MWPSSARPGASSASGLEVSTCRPRRGGRDMFEARMGCGYYGPRCRQPKSADQQASTPACRATFDASCSRPTVVDTNAIHLLLAATLCAYEQQNTYISGVDQEAGAVLRGGHFKRGGDVINTTREGGPS
jgi:hypothetical protein